MYYSKFKCIFGLHNWNYSDTENNIEHRIFVDKIRYTSRFCSTCFKKQTRLRYDMRILWIDSNKLTPHEQRQKILDTLPL